MDLKKIVLKLNEIGAVKFGEFKLKSGIMSPIYVDLRLLISYPQLLQEVVVLFWQKVKDLKFDLIIGVPYTALPIATAISLQENIPMIIRRKEVKEYGTKKAIEGVYKQGQICLIVDDLTTSGASLFETIEPLEHEGLKVSDIVVLIDREQGGKKHLQEKGYNLQALLTISEVLDILLAEGKLTQEMYKKTLDFIKNNQV
jgi:uridine monophosphate synthetase